MTDTVVERLQHVRRKLAKWNRKLIELQDECSHPDLTGVRGSDSGNFNRQADSEWIDMHCPTCGKRWVVDGGTAEYRRYSLGRDPVYKCTFVNNR